MKNALKWAGMISLAVAGVLAAACGAIGLGEAISWIGGAR